MRVLTILLGVSFSLNALLFLEARPASAQSATHCDGYARDFAARNSRGRVAGGVIKGIIGGGLIGAIVRRGRGVGPGALIGGGVGALLGGKKQSREYNALYVQAYNSCMRRR